MSGIDWSVLFIWLAVIVGYGVWKGRGSKNIEGFLLADRSIRWPMVLLSVMATQASAITFISTPGQAYVDGMRFVQFYLGLPLAMIVLSITAIPIYHRLKVYTAYEYLEDRFDSRTRCLTALLFLIQRGLAAGLTIYAPAIIFSTLLGMKLSVTILIMGGLVIIYTTSGGAKAVSWTHRLQMMIIFLGLAVVFFVILWLLPQGVSLSDALFVSGKMGKLKAIDFSLDFSNRYNFWSGIIGGFFLALSYFGTDQSQVQRYITGQSVTHSRLGLLANGLVKVPMQFFILLLGALVFAFYQFTAPPLFFNTVDSRGVETGRQGQEYRKIKQDYQAASQRKSQLARAWMQARRAKNPAKARLLETRFDQSSLEANSLRTKGVAIIQKQSANPDVNDTNYIFLSFLLKHMPIGLLGLVIAAIFTAAMSSVSSELNALASTTVIDMYKRFLHSGGSDGHYLLASRLLTIGWGLFAILFAQFANHLGSLIEAVNILGSLFYGTILGIFLVAFYIKPIQGQAVFYASLLAEAGVLLLFFFSKISFLWYNVAGCLLVISFSVPLQFLMKKKYS